jgi:hypothetical protein
MRALFVDLHDAIRGLRRDRAYSAIVIVLLALTIGATTAIFSIVDGVLLKPLTFPQSERLVTVRPWVPARSAAGPRHAHLHDMCASKELRGWYPSSRRAIGED